MLEAKGATFEEATYAVLVKFFFFFQFSLILNFKNFCVVLLLRIRPKFTQFRKTDVLRNTRNGERHLFESWNNNTNRNNMLEHPFIKVY